MDAVDEYVDFLVADMRAAGRASDPDPKAFANAELAKAKAKIAAGRGQMAFYTSGSVNGKAFTAAQVLTTLDVASACRTAIDIYEGVEPTRFGVTVPDFSGSAGGCWPCP